MPYKRFSPISDTFLVTPFGSVFRQIEFFNSHRRLHSEPFGLSEIAIFRQLRPGLTGARSGTKFSKTYTDIPKPKVSSHDASVCPARNSQSRSSPRGKGPDP